MSVKGGQKVITAPSWVTEFLTHEEIGFAGCSLTCRVINILKN